MQSSISRFFAPKRVPTASPTATATAAPETKRSPYPAGAAIDLTYDEPASATTINNTGINNSVDKDIEARLSSLEPNTLRSHRFGQVLLQASERWKTQSLHPPPPPPSPHPHPHPHHKVTSQEYYRIIPN